MPGLYACIDRFISEHRAHGAVGWRVTEPTAYGYRVWLACPCGARLDRWLTADRPRRAPRMAPADLARPLAPPPAAR